MTSLHRFLQTPMSLCDISAFILRRAPSESCFSLQRPPLSLCVLKNQISVDIQIVLCIARQSQREAGTALVERHGMARVPYSIAQFGVVKGEAPRLKPKQQMRSPCR